MSGITVGIDGSAHSSRALEWAVNEAAVRRAPVTVLTVHPVAMNAWIGTPSSSRRTRRTLRSHAWPPRR